MSMISGVNILLNQPGASPFTVENLADVHPLWAKETKKFEQAEPWRLDSIDGKLELLRVASGADVLIVRECATTMELAAKFAQQGLLPPWGAVMAVNQSEARGQLRRPWTSLAGNLHLSWILPTAHDPAWNTLLPLVMGWCLCIGLEKLGAPMQLKWPNDLIQNQAGELKKTCGLLIEDRGTQVIVGAGINLAHAPTLSQLRADHAFPASVVDFYGPRYGPLSLWQKLVMQTKKEYSILLDNIMPCDFIARLSQRLLWLGEEVFLDDGSGIRPVRLLGLALDGGLRILDQETEKVVYSGTLSHHLT